MTRVSSITNKDFTEHIFFSLSFFLCVIVCIRAAFAELQTDMTDLTADLQSLGTPTLDHKTYVMKVFFPGVNDHPILNDPKVKR